MKRHPYVGLWLLVSLALLLFVGYSFWEGELDVWGWKPKKGSFRETLLSKEESQPSHGDGIPSVGDAALEEVVHAALQTDSLPQSILLIGDSMTLNLAYRLSRYAAQNGHDFHAVNWDSSNTKIWAQCDTLSHFINEFNATFIFVSLGSNELYLKNTESRRPYVQRILQMIGDRPYVWIGPPNWKEDYGINDMIASECRPGTFFRSAGMEFERKKDHVHPTRLASALWIDSVMRWLPKSAHPILAEVPSDSLGKVNPNVTFLKALNK